MADPLLSILGVRKLFGGVAAVCDVAMTVAAGEIRGLIGPNGSGKTTLLNLIGGQERPDGGEIRLDGRRISGLPADRIAALGVARTFQVPRVFRSMTVLDNVLVPACADHRRTAWAQARGRAETLLRLTRLDAMGRMEARALSGGQAMLLQMARCLAAEPLVLCLLDEPFAGVHPAIKARMIETIVQINRERGVAFLIVSHEMSVLGQLAPRVSVMHNGAWIAEGPLADVAGNPRVVEAYLGRGGSGPLSPAAPGGV